MKFRKLLLFTLVLLNVFTFAQGDYRPGYVITNSIDTIYGQIEYRGELFMGRECKFKDSADIKTTYLPNELQGYRFIDGKYYISGKIDNEDVFLEFLINGEVNIYYWRNNLGDHYFIDNDSSELTEIPYKEGTKYVDNKLVHYETTKHTGVLYYYMQDAPELETRIKSIKKPTHNNLLKLAEDYHNIVCKDEVCIIYEKKIAPVAIEIGLEAGALVPNYKNGYINFIEKNFLTNTNLTLFIGMPRNNENLYFKTGLFYNGSLADSSGTSYHFFTVPLAFEYRFQTRNLQPTIGYGLGFQFYEKGSRFISSFNVGFKYFINKFYLTTNFNADFLPIFVIVPYYGLSYNINIGLGINLSSM